MVIDKKISDLLEVKFSEEAFSTCFLIELKIHPGNKIEVFIDSDEGVSFSTCQQISRYLEHHIDENGWLGATYVLEVSSPGVSRPLKLKRQYPKHIGRKFEVKQIEGETVTGTLTEVSDSGIVLEEKARVKEGNKKKSVVLTHEVAFDHIEKAIVKISFSK
ncbi:MAG: ribosome assembly cofactor RimP [Saprospiraceae bacterium]|nr:ribosome assembly cofactor RimP [Saprospiraceae bacterium]MCB9325109.1 ribosome assembly cofactor RimP [Lewinellaceae bacterium]